MTATYRLVRVSALLLSDGPLFLDATVCDRLQCLPYDHMLEEIMICLQRQMYAYDFPAHCFGWKCIRFLCGGSPFCWMNIVTAGKVHRHRITRCSEVSVYCLERRKLMLVCSDVVSGVSSSMEEGGGEGWGEQGEGGEIRGCMGTPKICMHDMPPMRVGHMLYTCTCVALPSLGWHKNMNFKGQINTTS